jgi:hypothetical protein
VSCRLGMLCCALSWRGMGQHGSCSQRYSSWLKDAGLFEADGERLKGRI